MSPRGTEVRLGCVYRREWPDGFGAGGWKLRAALDDPNIIASTPVTGERIPTSVFVHDILDHALCGLPPSGHRAEAVALLQLAERTGADPQPDFAQMVDEDLLLGQADGDALRDLLPADLLALLPPPGEPASGPSGDGKAVIAALTRTLGREALRARLIRRLFEFGEQGAARARGAFAAHGLSVSRRRALGLALQGLFAQAHQVVAARGAERVEAVVGLNGHRCRFELTAPMAWAIEAAY
jgi:hypothetical protein